MLRHVVCFRWVDGTTDEQVARLCELLAALPSAIPELRRYRFGADAGLADGNFDFAVVADFDHAEGWQAYLDHSDHLVVVEHLRPMVSERARVQFELHD